VRIPFDEYALRHSLDGRKIIPGLPLPSSRKAHSVDDSRRKTEDCTTLSSIWTDSLELRAPAAAESLNPAARFARLACVIYTQRLLKGH